MKEICNKNFCTGCGLCTVICPKQCISFEANEEGFFYPNINIQQCINCSRCVKNCPMINESKNIKKDILKSYYGWSNNNDVRKDSSSGGIFTELAELIIKNEGVVYGASFNEDFSISHIGVTELEELRLLRGSKYFQSDIRKVYASVKKDIIEGKKVLFSGTGCQIEALYRYLGIEQYDNLLTVEILCHGVPSKKVVCQYIDSIHENGEITKICFRDKSRYGWKYSCIFSAEFSDGYQYYGRSSSDLFYLGFLNEAFLRESCYNCKYVGKKRVGDVLLADFWGIDNESKYDISQSDLELGISFVTSNSEKGTNVLELLINSNSITMLDADYELAARYNKALVSNYKRPIQRDRIFSDINKYGYKRAIKKAFPNTYYKIFLYKLIKTVIGRKT